ncbi:sensory box protein [Acinetobacter sp. 25977_7]|nr:sensory box protein [Acinetobacter sp. 25977_7]
MHGPDTYVVHNYQAMYDDNGNYAGINEYILDFKPIVDWYLKQTGQELVGGKKVDAVSGASKKEAPETADSVSSASVHEEESATDKPTVDSVSSASIKE